MINKRLFENNLWRYIFLGLICISYPLYVINPLSFCVVLILICFIIFFILNKIFNSNSTIFDLLLLLFKITLFGLVIVISTIIFKNNAILNKSVIIFVYLLLIMYITYSVYGLIWVMTKVLQKISLKESMNKIAIFLCVILIITTITSVEIVFSFGYKMFFWLIYKDKLEVYEAYYLSFIISYTIPINNEKFLEYINKISREPVLSTYQMMQVYLKKLTEFIWIAILVGNFQIFVKRWFEKELANK